MKQNKEIDPDTIKEVFPDDEELFKKVTEMKKKQKEEEEKIKKKIEEQTNNNQQENKLEQSNVVFSDIESLLNKIQKLEVQYTDLLPELSGHPKSYHRMHCL